MICSLIFKKYLILKMLLWILCFWFWSYTPSKLSHFQCGKNLPWASYCCSFWATSADVLVTNHSSLLLVGIFGNSGKCSTLGTFVIIFLICSDLLDCHIFCCFDVFTVWTPLIQVQTKISTIRPVFQARLPFRFLWRCCIFSLKTSRVFLIFIITVCNIT